MAAFSAPLLLSFSLSLTFSTSQAVNTLNGGSATAAPLSSSTSPIPDLAALDIRYVNDGAGEVGPDDIPDGTLTGGDVSTSSGNVTFGGSATVAAVQGIFGTNSFTWAQDSTVSGGHDNSTWSSFATISGGLANQAYGAASTVGGGNGNTAQDNDTVVAGGISNTAGGAGSAIGGGNGNTTSHFDATISGGNQNVASGYATAIGGGIGNQAQDQLAVIAGGLNNIASAPASTIGGGNGNTASEADATVAGGTQNVASGHASAVGGGIGNQAQDQLAVIAGGLNNIASAPASTIGGGNGNTASGNNATVAGGALNVASGHSSTVAGGDQGQATGSYSTVIGGEFNAAQGSHSLAGGTRAKAIHHGSFVWGDNLQVDKASSIQNEFNVYASGGARFFTPNFVTPMLSIAPTGFVGVNTATPGSHLDVNGSIRCISLVQTSDARLKRDVEDLAGSLDRLRQLRGVSYKWNDGLSELEPGRQLGFLAQEVREVVPEVVREDEQGQLSVAYSALIPVLVEAVQELEGELHERDDRLTEIEAELAERDSRLAELEREAEERDARLAELESHLARLVSDK